jgi:hypothetical protein
MALPSAGSSISLQQVNVELGNTGTDAINMGSSAVRTLFDDASGAISMSDGFGKSSELGLTASAASSANLKTLFDNASAGSWAGSTAKRYTINSGTTMGIITAPASMGGTLIIAHSGAIQGVGGTANGGAGATAMTIQSANITINMASGSTISGGGGGGGQGGTGGGGNFVSSTPCSGSNPGGCTLTGFGACDGGDANTYACYSNTNGGAGGAGGRGAGYGQALANGSSGSGGGTSAGAGGTGGNGASFGAAGATGATGANGNRTNGSSGSAGGAAGRAITFSGVSAYTIIGTASGTIHGAYT